MENFREGGVLDSVLGAIGHTPLVELSRITRGLEGRILANRVPQPGLFQERPHRFTDD